MHDEQGFVPSFVEPLPLARAALAYARDHHGQQRRGVDEAPFILHPLEVAALLYNTGHGEPVVAAGILHDTLEDTDAEAGDLAARFGAQVASLVDALTEDDRIEAYVERKAALRRQVAEGDDDAAAIYAADKVAKVRELRAQLVREPALLEHDPERLVQRLEHYAESLLMLERRDRAHPLVRQLRFELEALRALPPRTEPPHGGPAARALRRI